jgi:hypothetical protein
MPFCTSGHRVECGHDGAECQRTDEATDLALGIADLGAAFLGGVRFTAPNKTDHACE